MKNTEALDRFEQAHGANIEKIFWIAGSLENSDLKDFIEEMDDKAFKKCFPAIYKSIDVDEYRDSGELLQELLIKEKLGLIAEITIPIAEGFDYDKDGNVKSWSSNGGRSRVDYVYAETLELLLVEIEKTSKTHFKNFIKEDKRTNAPTQ